MNTPKRLPARPNLRMADPRLPMTVSRAAIELDDASRGVSANFESTQRFAKFLSDSLKQNLGGGGAHAAFLDANTVDVIGQALNEFEGTDTVRTVEDVFNHTCKLIAEMEGASTAPGGSDLERLRRFCVVFGNNLLTHRASLKH